MQRQIEEPYFGQFRKNLTDLFGQEYARTQQPIYGPAQIANVLSQSNQLFSDTMDKIGGTLAARGGLRSGAMDTAASTAGIASAANTSSFLNQLPFMEEQTRRVASSQLLGLGAGWTGRSPLSQIFSSEGKTSENSTTNALSQSTQQGAPWWKNLLTNVGGMIPGLTENWANNRIKVPGWVYDPASYRPDPWNSLPWAGGSDEDFSSMFGGR